MTVKLTIKILCPIFLFIISLNNVIAQEEPHYIQGQVVDENNDPLPGARVLLMRGDTVIKAVGTDKNGFFSVKTDAHGDLVLKVDTYGYGEYETKISFNNTMVFSKPIKIKSTAQDGGVIDIIQPSKFKENPGTITELKKEDIDLIQPMGTEELFTYTPGIIGFGDDGVGNSRLSIGIRGLNPRRSSRVLVLEDGIPINPGIYIYPNMYYNPPVERLDELEVLKGSAALQYGPQTMGGVVNYITSRPRQELGGFTQLTIGNNGYRSFFNEIGGWGNNEKLRPEIQLLLKSGDGYRDNNEFQQLNSTVKLLWQPNEYKNIYFKANYNNEVSNATYTGLTEYSFKNTPKFNPKNNDIFRVNRGAIDMIYSNELSDSLMSTTKVYGNYFKRDWWRENDVFIKASSLGAWQNGAVIGTDIVAQSPTSNTDLVRVGNGVDNFGILREFYVAGVEQNYRYDHKLFNKGSLLNIGGRYHWESFADEFKIGDSPTDREGALYEETTDTSGTVIRTALNGAKSLRFYTTSFSGFLEEEMTLIDSTLNIRFGTRAEAFEQEVIDLLDGAKYTDKTTIVVLPGFGFNYSLDSMNIFGGVHRGFTPPTSALFNIVRADAIDAEDLKSETSWNYEIGFRGKNRWINYELAGFYLDITDMVAAARNSVFINVGEVSTMGIEFTGKINSSRFASFLPDINISYTGLNTRVDNGEIVSHLAGYNNNTDPIDTISIVGNELPYAPKHSFTIGLSKNLLLGEKKKKLNIRTDMRYVSQVYTDLENLTFEDVQNGTYTTTSGTINYLGHRGDAGPVPSYYIFNASANYQLNEHWYFGIAAKNLTDNIYISSRLHSHPSRPDATGSSGILVGARRQVNLTIKYNF